MDDKMVSKTSMHDGLRVSDFSGGVWRGESSAIMEASHVLYKNLETIMIYE